MRGGNEKYLMTEFVVAPLEFIIRNPDRNAIPLAEEALINLLPEILLEAIGGCPKGSNPDLLPHPFADTIDSIAQTSIASSAWLKVPVLLVEFP